jgi:hypothetical protein
MNNIGKVYEIATPRGLACIQVTHRNPEVGVLPRVLSCHFAERPSALAGGGSTPGESASVRYSASR